MPKMKVVQVPKAGGDLEIVERDIPKWDQDRSGFASRHAVFATAM